MIKVDFNIDKVRKDFPILSREIYKRPLVYFDNAATNQKPVQVLNRMDLYYENQNSNIHRGVHFLSQEATSAYEEARETIKTFINAHSRSEVVFTKGTTDAINLVAHSLGRKLLKAGDEILITFMEHHSNIVPWQMVCETTGAYLKVCNITEKGEIDIEDFKTKLSRKTRIVALNHVSNTLGTINPVKEIIKITHDAGALVLIDGAQAVAHLQVDVQDLDCDFYCFSGHKIYAPMGTGVLYGKEDILDKMPPYQGGGEMIAMVSFEKTTYNELPFKFEAGTPNVGGALGLEAAIKYVNGFGLATLAGYEDDLLKYGTEKLLQIEGLRIYGESALKTGVISFNLNKVHSYDAGTLIDKFGIAVRTGHLCTQPLVGFFGVPGFIRASFAMYNTKQEIDKLVEAVIKTREMLL
ncbi:MAG: cysteine desulfurase [Bacteroidales bacterium]|nr:cysteine desulfurase [Bacteroidales bacterium]